MYIPVPYLEFIGFETLALTMASPPGECTLRVLLSVGENTRGYTIKVVKRVTENKYKW